QTAAVPPKAERPANGVPRLPAVTGTLRHDPLSCRGWQLPRRPRRACEVAQSFFETGEHRFLVSRFTYPCATSRGRDDVGEGTAAFMDVMPPRKLLKHHDVLPVGTFGQWVGGQRVNVSLVVPRLARYLRLKPIGVRRKRAKPGS